MSESAYKVPSKKSNASKGPNAFKSTQPSKPAIKIAAAEETTDESDLANLVATLMEKISKMELDCKGQRLQSSLLPTTTTKANAASTLGTPKPKKAQKTANCHRF